MLTTKDLIAETDHLLASLPEDKVRSVRDFAAFLAGQTAQASSITSDKARSEQDSEAVLAQQAWANLPLVDDNLSTDETEEEFAADTKAIIQHSRAYDFLHDD